MFVLLAFVFAISRGGVLGTQYQAPVTLWQTQQQFTFQSDCENAKANIEKAFSGNDIIVKASCLYVR